MAQSILLAVNTKKGINLLSKQKLSLSDGRVSFHLVCEQKLPKTKFWGVFVKIYDYEQNSKSSSITSFLQMTVLLF